ncbi:IclR family transcriptional regulator [Phyllobacterium trifolii]|nr:IclR family transcriptional regulator [Phyllobacterium trifolii]
MNSEVKSAGRILDILEYMSSCREPIPLSKIVSDLSLPKSSTHGLVQTLAARGHVSRNSMGHYVLVESSRHGFPFRRHEEPLVVTAMPFMERLRDESGETVLLSTMNARCDMRRLAKCVSHHPVRYDVNMDAAITAYCTATGRVLLAHSPAEVLESYLSRVKLLSYTGFTITDVRQIRDILANVRRDGYAVNDQEFITGSTGIAAPLYDAKGNVVAALNLGTLTSRYVPRREELLLLLRGAADQISRASGYETERGRSVRWQHPIGI